MKSTRLKLNHHNTQSGINMVDLMMWLVIAALILAAAIQGIGYYQQAAYLYHVKNDVMGGATKVLSVSGVDHNGSIDQSIVDEGLAITDKTAQVVLVSDVDPNGRPMIRGTHPGLPGREVDYFFYPYAQYAASTEYIVNVGTIPSGSTSGSTSGSGGTSTVSFLPNGDWNHNGVPNSTDPAPAGTPAEDLSSPGMGDGTSAATIGTITGDGSGSYTPKSTSWLGGYGTPMSNLLPSGTLDLSGPWTPSTDGKTVNVVFKTDGSFTGVGGSWNYMVHVDVSCYDTVSQTYSTVSDYKYAILRGPYTQPYPGPNSSSITLNCGVYATPSQKVSQALIRTATDAEWASYSIGRPGWAYSLPNLSEGWVSSTVPQQ